MRKLDSTRCGYSASRDDAVQQGLALFGEKYGDPVRVLTMGNGYSMELCGGTHVQRTGDIGLFKIVSETGIAAGIRRVEAVTGHSLCRSLVHEEQVLLNSVSDSLKVGRREIGSKLQQLIAENRALARQVEQMSHQLAASLSSDLSAQVEEIAGISFIAAQVEGDSKAMMQTLDTMRSQLPSDAVVVLAAIDNGRVGMVSAIGKSLSGALSAAELIQTVAPAGGRQGWRASRFGKSGRRRPSRRSRTSPHCCPSMGRKPAGFISNRGIFAAQVSVSMDE